MNAERLGCAWPVRRCRAGPSEFSAPDATAIPEDPSHGMRRPVEKPHRPHILTTLVHSDLLSFILLSRSLSHPWFSDSYTKPDDGNDGSSLIGYTTRSSETFPKQQTGHPIDQAQASHQRITQCEAWILLQPQRHSSCKSSSYRSNRVLPFPADAPLSVSPDLRHPRPVKTTPRRAPTQARFTSPERFCRLSLLSSSSQVLPPRLSFRVFLRKPLVIHRRPRR